MRDVYLATFSVINYRGMIDSAGIVLTAREGADENEVGLEATALLPAANIKRIMSLTVAQLDNETLKAIALIALAKGLV